MSTSSLEVVGKVDSGPRSCAITKWDFWVCIVPLLAMTPLLLIQWQHLMSRPERQFFPLLVCIAFYFPLRSIYSATGCSSELLVPIGRLRFALAALGTGVLFYAFSALAFSPWLAHVAAIIVFFAWALGRCVASTWTCVLAWSGLLAVTVPLPMGFDQDLIASLQASSSWACSMALDGLGVPHFRSANVIEVRGRQLFVEEACSGIGSLYALLAAAALLVLINGRSLLVAILTILSVPVWAMLGNFTRLLAIALAQHHYQRDLSHGSDHEILGLLTFALAALGLWMTEWVAARWFQAIPPTAPEFGFLFRTINASFCWPNPDPFASIVDTEGETPSERAQRESEEAAERAAFKASITRVHVWDITPLRIFIKSATVFVALMGLIPAIILVRGSSRDMFSFNLPHFDDAALENMPGADSMPKTLGDAKSGVWQRIGFQTQRRSTASFFGEYSRIWEYQRGTDRFLLSLDFPFRGSHPLEVCYTNSGWTVEGLKPSGGPDPTSWKWTEFLMRNEFGSRGFVCYALMTEDAEPFNNSVGAMKRLNIVERITQNPELASSAFQPVCFQVQVLCESGSKLSDAERSDIRQCFLQARALIRDQIARRGSNPSTLGVTQ